jgi:hypothetical protein
MTNKNGLFHSFPKVWEARGKREAEIFPVKVVSKGNRPCRYRFPATALSHLIS